MENFLQGENCRIGKGVALNLKLGQTLHLKPCSINLWLWLFSFLTFEKEIHIVIVTLDYNAFWGFKPKDTEKEKICTRKCEQGDMLSWC